MRKFTLFLVALFLSVGAMAQTPVLRLTSDQIGQTYPYVLSDEDAAKVFEITGSYTVVLDVTTGANVTTRGAFVCAADPTVARCSSATKVNTPYFAFGNKDGKISYIASSKDGDQFSYGALSASTNYKIVFTVNVTGTNDSGATTGRLEAFKNGELDALKANFPWSNYELPTFKKVKENYDDAKIYIGGGMTASGSLDVFGGIIHSVQFFSGVLTSDQIAAMGYPKHVDSKYYYLKCNGYYLSNQKTETTLTVTTEKGVKNIFYYDVEGSNTYLVAYENGHYVTNPWNIGIGEATINEREIYKQTKTFVEGTDGKYALQYYADNGGAYYFNVTDGATNASTDKSNANGQWTLEEVASLPVTITEAKYATFYAPVAVEVAEGVKAYTVTINGNWATLNEIIGGVIPANTGVVLYAETAGTYNFTITEDVEAIADNALRGTAAATYVTEDAYVLTADATSETGVCFGLATKNQQSNTSWLNNSHKAYLPASAANGAAYYSFRFGEGTTGVENVEVENSVNVIYDLTGRRVEAITAPGIYIVNGKKTLVK